MKTFLVQLNHPAHFYLFKNVIENLKKKNNVIIVAKQKDILFQLLDIYKYDYYKISNKYRRKNIPSILGGLVERDKQLFHILKKNKPDLMFGTSPEIGHLTRLTGIPSIFFGEDDVNLNLSMYMGSIICYPFFSSIISPVGVNNKQWNKKTIFYSGFQKLAYLHPKVFHPDRSKVHVPRNIRYFIIRFSALNAYHDKLITGIDYILLDSIISYLNSFGQILITSEKEIPIKYEKYLFKGSIDLMHHYLNYADLFIGDSQSMAVEAAVLGVPGIRYNDFVGKITVLNQLEDQYKLAFGIKSGLKQELLNKIKYLVETPRIKEEFMGRKEKMLTEKIVVSKFFVWLIENYPESIKEMQANPEIQYQFK